MDFSKSQLDEFEKVVVKMGVKIVGSIDELLRMTDVILIETNDRPHLEQVMVSVIVLESN